MQFLKKTICLNISVRAAVIVLLLLVILFAGLAISRSNLPINLQLALLKVENVSSVSIYSGGAAQFQPITDEQMLNDIISTVNEVCLSGKPYQLSLVGGSPVWYQIELKNGQVLILGGTRTGDYFYFLNGLHYYICSDEAANESKDLFVWKRLEALHEQQIKALSPST